VANLAAPVHRGGDNSASSRENSTVTVPLAAPTDANQWVRARIGASGFRVDVNSRTHHLAADEPRVLGGTDSGPTPYELMLTALASCSAMTMRMYADRKGWPLEEAIVWLRQARPHQPDCEQCPTERVGMGSIERRMELTGPLTEEQRLRLLEIADRCPVKQTLERGITIV
jgi:putative redox protein